eukprot:Skav202485  [mRNA]  locus=scaffold149:862557:865469:+ [translate_table: standard]
MACVNVPASAFAPISRLMARVWGNSDSNDAKVAFTKPKTINVEAVTDTKSETTEDTALKPRRTKELRIDTTTVIPADLYWSMLRAGERAKNGGQHRLKSSSRGVDCNHLVKTDG